MKSPADTNLAEPFVGIGHEQVLRDYVSQPTEPPSRRIDRTFEKTTLLSLVVMDNAQLLTARINNLRQEWDIHGFAKQLWHFALIEAKPNTFAALCTLSLEKDFRFSVCDALNNSPEVFQRWALTIPVARNLWLSQTKPLAAEKGYTLVHGLRVLEDNDCVKELRATLDAKSDYFHHQMRVFIREYAMQTLMQNGLFLHTIAYYGEPTKKHLRVAATGTNPVYDLKRMEEHWPGVQGVVSALGGLGLSKTACEARIRSMISNKQATKLAQELSAEMPTDFLGT